MLDLKTSSNVPSQVIPKWFPVALLLVGLAGFLDAGYLTAKHLVGSPVTCTVLKGCEVVTSSSFSVVAGIPVAAFGAFYYLAVFLLAVAYLDTKRTAYILFAARLTFIGFLASLWFIFVQAFLLKAWCLYCLGSAVTSTILFGASLVFFIHKKYATTTD